MTRTLRTILLGALLAATQAAAFQNEPTGFRGINWGQPFDTIAEQFNPGRTLNDGTIHYTRKNDRLSIGNAQLDVLFYGFYRGQFYTVGAGTEGITNRVSMLEALISQFGQPIRPNRYIHRYYWSGSVSRISLSCDPSDRCLAIISSTELRQLKVEEQRARGAEKAKDDF